MFQAADHSLVTRDRRTESGFRLTLTETRRALDAGVFEYLGLTAGERDGVYNAVYAAVVGRRLRRRMFRGRGVDGWGVIGVAAVLGAWYNGGTSGKEV